MVHELGRMGWRDHIFRCLLCLHDGRTGVVRYMVCDSLRLLLNFLVYRAGFGIHFLV